MDLRRSRVLLIGTLIIAAGVGTIAQAEQSSQLDPVLLKEYRIDRGVSEVAKGCIECHAKENAGIVADWAGSRHAHVNVTCLDCHAAGPADADGRCPACP